MIRHLSEILHEFIEKINYIDIKMLEMYKLTIPDLSVVANNHDYIPQAPPNKKPKESIRNRFMKSRAMNWLKSNIKELPSTIAQNFMYDLFKFAIFGAITYFMKQ